MRNQSTIESLETRQLLAANLVADFGGIYPTSSVDIHGITYFTAEDVAHGLGLWRSDGSVAGTSFVGDLPDHNQSIQMYAANDRVLIVLRGNAWSLWSSDGNSGGTQKIADLTNNDIGGLPAAVANDKLIFLVQGGPDNPKTWVWSSDGTTAGTGEVAKVLDTSPGNYGVIDQMFAIGDRVVFNDNNHVWSSDGTAAGTFQIPPSVAGLDHWNLHTNTYISRTVGGGAYLFVDATHNQLMRTDGTIQGTSVLMEMDGWADGFNVLGSQTIFYAWDAAEGQNHLWVTDGSLEGTHELMPISSGFFAVPTTVGQKFFMIIPTENHGTEEHPMRDIQLWTTDGTDQGSTLVKQFDHPMYFSPLVTVGDKVFFLSRDLEDRDFHVALWVSDGTDAGTRIIRDFDASIRGLHQVQLTEVDGRLAVVVEERTTLLLDPSTMSTPVGPHQAYFSLRDGILRVFGTQGDDNIRIYRHAEVEDRFVVCLNGVKRSFALSSVNRIHIYGFSGDDNIAANEKLGRITLRSRIWGGSGDDVIYTGSARDTIYGEAGDDRMNSGRNADVAMGGVGDDWIYGGLSDDTVSGEGGADTVNGAGGADLVSGGDDSSDDQLEGGAGIDVIFGHAVYEIFYSGQQGQDPSGLDEVLMM